MKNSELVKIKEIVENADFISEQTIVTEKAIAVIQKEFEEHYNASTSGGALYKIMEALDALNDGTESTKEVLDFVKHTTLSVCGCELDERELKLVLRRSHYDDYEK